MTRAGAARVARGVAAALAGLAVMVPAFAICAPRLALGQGGVLDVLGVLAGAAGAAAVVLGMRLALRGTTWRGRAVAVVAGLAITQFVVVPVVGAAFAVNAPRHDVPAAATLGLPGAEDVTLAAGDGTRLAASYVPGRTGAAVVVLHGAHRDRTAAEAHLRMLARAGFAVLAVDARGHGESGGTTNALGWRGADDVAGAVAWLGGRPGVDPGRIGVLGLSMGGEAALRAAATGVPVAAVVADGAGASTTGDERLAGAGALPASVSWATMRAVELLSGDDEPPALADLAPRIGAPVLLVASGADDELAIDRALAARIGAGAELWPVPDAGHVEAIERHPQAYAARVAGFLRRTLAGSG